MENSIAQETAVLSLATQVVSSTVGANADSAANIDLKEYRPKKKKSHKLLCLALLDRCDAIQKDNERLVHRIHQVVKQLRRSRVERKFIMDRLVKHGVNWKEVKLQIDLETESPSIEVVNLKNQETPEMPNEKKNSDLKSTEKKDLMSSKTPANPFFKFCQLN